ncbi:2-dehydro-3-deoxy-D-gluconate 5-dehydrogenase [Fusarium oxysporum f. sp. albedinis]|nr:2-dehydro-3-deoxy-D-gluconate 5-dehydrogenase [Fusarium oxysporum f. sp. albedinis]
MCGRNMTLCRIPVQIEAVQDVSSVIVQLDTHRRLVDSVQCSALARIYMQNIYLTCKETCIMCEKHGSFVPSLPVVRPPVVKIHRDYPEAAISICVARGTYYGRAPAPLRHPCPLPCGPRCLVSALYLHPETSPEGTCRQLVAPSAGCAASPNDPDGRWDLGPSFSDPGPRSFLFTSTPHLIQTHIRPLRPLPLPIPFQCHLPDQPPRSFQFPPQPPHFLLFTPTTDSVSPYNNINTNTNRQTPNHLHS